MRDPGKDDALGNEACCGDKGKDWEEGEQMNTFWFLFHCDHPDPLCTLPDDLRSSLAPVRGSKSFSRVIFLYMCICLQEVAGYLPGGSPLLPLSNFMRM